jgi:hypothetical protein
MGRRIERFVPVRHLPRDQMDGQYQVVRFVFATFGYCMQAGSADHPNSFIGATPD